MSGNGLVELLMIKCTSLGVLADIGLGVLHERLLEDIGVISRRLVTHI